jgi:hypothetical protein
LLGCWIAIVDCTHVIHKLKHSRYLLLIVPYVMTSYVCDGWWVMWLVWLCVRGLISVVLPMVDFLAYCCASQPGKMSIWLLLLIAWWCVKLQAWLYIIMTYIYLETASLIVHHHDLHLLGKFLPQMLVCLVDVIGCDFIVIPVGATSSCSCNQWTSGSNTSVSDGCII